MYISQAALSTGPKVTQMPMSLQRPISAQLHLTRRSHIILSHDALDVGLPHSPSLPRDSRQRWQTKKPGATLVLRNRAVKGRVDLPRDQRCGAREWLRKFGLQRSGKVRRLLLLRLKVILYRLCQVANKEDCCRKCRLVRHDVRQQRFDLRRKVDHGSGDVG